MKWVPISFCQFCIENKCMDAGKLFCYLKYHSDGIANKTLLNKARRYFDKSERTIRRWLKKALFYNWIGQEKEILFIRGWQYLYNTFHFQKKACFRFRKSDLKKFNTYCFAAVISYMARRTQVKELERFRRYPIKGRSQQAPAWVPMASKAIAKTLKIPKSTAQHYRQKAVLAKYFQKKSTIRPLGINVRELELFKKFCNDSNKHLIIKSGRVFEQLPDKIKIESNKIHTPRRYFIKKKKNRLSPKVWLKICPVLYLLRNAHPSPNC